jgi:hypothetical protein
MTKTEILSDLHIPRGGCGDISIEFDGQCVRAKYEIRRHGEDQVGTITFDGVSAFRFQAERAMSKYVEGSYDALIKIAGSDWGEQPGRSQGIQSGVRHFAVFFSSNGYLEVLANAATVGDPVAGTLSR